MPSPDSRSSTDRRGYGDEHDWGRDDRRRSDDRYDRRERHRDEDRPPRGRRGGRWDRGRDYDDPYYDDPYYDDPYPRRERRRRRREADDSSAWQTVHSGLIIGICGTVPMGVILFILLLVSIFSLSGNDIFPATIEWVIYGTCGSFCAGILSLIVMFIGRCLCCSVPKDTQGHAFGIASMIFFLIPVLPLHFIFFGMFVKKIGEYLHDYRLAQQAYVFALVSCFVFGGGFILMVVLGIWSQQQGALFEFSETVGRSIWIGIVGSFLGLLIWQLVLSWWTSRVVSQATASPQVLPREIY